MPTVIYFGEGNLRLTVTEEADQVRAAFEHADGRPFKLNELSVGEVYVNPTRIAFWRGVPPAAGPPGPGAPPPSPGGPPHPGGPSPGHPPGGGPPPGSGVREPRRPGPEGMEAGVVLPEPEDVG